jgi:putative SOS response-associated peptidase YedK
VTGNGLRIYRQPTLQISAHIWNFRVLDGAKDLKVGFSNINAKAEGIENRPAFREAYQRRRCLVPVDNFLLSRRDLWFSVSRAGPVSMAGKSAAARITKRDSEKISAVTENTHGPQFEVSASLPEDRF